LLWIVGQSRDRLQGSFEARQGLATCAAVPGLKPGSREVSTGTIPNTGLSVVDPDSGAVGIEVAAVNGFERLGDLPVQQSATRY
jgi:hypothetical protein